MKNFKNLLLAGVSLGLVMTAPMSLVQAKEVSKEAGTPDSGTLKRADHDMKKVIEKLQSLGGKPIETLTPEEARQQPTAADAVNGVLKDKGKSLDEVKAKLGVTTKDLTYPAGEGDQKARVYFPKEKADKDKPYPILVYYHGGGFVIADIDVYDATPRSLSALTKAIVVSVEYRHAPEAKFPAQQDDAFAAYKWVLDNAASWGGDPANVAVSGESAGGNLALNTAIKARDEKIQAPVYMALVYPVAGNDMNTKSYKENMNAKPLNKAMMEWFVKNTISTDADKNDPRLNLIGADLKNLPPSTIVTAEIDPLHDDGKLLSEKLKNSGDKVNYKDYEGVTHEFFGMAGVVSDATAAQKTVAGDLKGAFEDQQKKEKKAAKK